MKPLLLCLLLTLPAAARLGETPAQCAARYGTLIEKWEDGSWMRFAKGMIRVECTFEGGKCVVIEYQLASAGGTTPQYDERFSEEARAQVLSANEGGSHFLPWKPELLTFQLNADGYKTEDGKRRAYLSSNTLRFEMVDYILSRRTGVLKDAVKESMKGF